MTDLLTENPDQLKEDGLEHGLVSTAAADFPLEVF